jgi:AAA+ superfamily predicted ATPase
LTVICDILKFFQLLYPCLNVIVLPNNVNVTCLVCIQVVSSAIVDKYIGESARLIREMFNYARDHQPCIIFMDEIDAIGLFFQFSL